MRARLEIVILMTAFVAALVGDVCIIVMVISYLWEVIVRVGALAILGIWASWLYAKQAKKSERLPPGVYRIVFDPVSHEP